MRVRDRNGSGHRTGDSVSTGLAFGLCVVGVVTSLALRWLYLTEPWRIDWATWPMFLGDEGALGMMAMHIVDGARPVFYYGGYYLGAFDAYVSALVFWLVGVSYFVFRAIPGVLGLLSVLLAFAIARLLYGVQGGLLAATLVALPSRFVFEWGSKSLPGFFVHVSLILVIVYLTLLLLERATTWRFLAWGFGSGVAIWNNLLAFPYVAVTGAALAWWVRPRRREVLLCLAAVAIGLAPLLYGNIVHPLATGRAIARKVQFSWGLSKEFVAPPNSEDTRQYHSMSVLQVMGAQPSQDGSFSIPGTAGAIFLALGLIWGAQRVVRGETFLDSRRHGVLVVLALLSVALGAGGFAGQPLGRYQLALYPLLVILAVGGLARIRPNAAVAVVAALALAHAAAIATPTPRHDRADRAAVIQALLSRGLNHGYTAGPMYDLILGSSERIIAVPLDHSRFPPYEKMVAAAPQVFYVYRDDQERKPAHQSFMKYLSENGVTYARVDVHDHHILYSFEPRQALSMQAIARLRKDFRHLKGA